MEKVWYKSYDPGVPRTINADQYTSLVQLLEECSERYCDKTSFINYGERITFKELDKKSKAFASYLQTKCNLKKGDRIAIMLPNILQYPIAVFGALRAGLVIVNLDPWIKDKKINKILVDTEAKVILFLDSYGKEIQAGLNKTKIKYLFSTSITDMLPFLKRVWFNFSFQNRKKANNKIKVSGAVNFLKALCDESFSEYKKVDLDSRDLAFLLYTEGRASGVEKCVMLSHRNMLANMLQCSSWMESFFRYKNAEAFVNPLPFSKATAIMGSLIMMRVGFATILITEPFNISALVKELKHYSYSIFYGVNSLFKALLQNNEFRELDFSKLKFTGSGGMPVHYVISEKWSELTGCAILQGFGLVEASAIVMMPPLSQKAYSENIGLPLPSTEIKVCDNNGVELALGETGELYIKGPQVMSGYWNKPGMTKTILDENGWLRTGDIVKIDQNGFVYLIDRLEDVIIRSGKKIYATHVERVIRTMPDIEEVGIVGVLDKNKKMIIQAYVVRNNPAITKEKIINFCKKNLSAEEIPDIIEFDNMLPHSIAGFLLRRVLRENAEQQMAAGEKNG